MRNLLKQRVYSQKFLKNSRSTAFYVFIFSYYVGNLPKDQFETNSTGVHEYRYRI